jgi:hypothetical protein
MIRKIRIQENVWPDLQISGATSLTFENDRVKVRSLDLSSSEASAWHCHDRGKSSIARRRSRDARD